MMTEAITALCSLCMIGAFFDLLFSGGKYEVVFRLMLAVYVSSAMVKIVKSII